MMTIVTHVHLKEGTGRDWDAAMRTRLSAVNKRPGWVGGQLLRPADNPNRRVIVGTWRTPRELGSMAPRSKIHGDAPAARRARERTSRALVARSHARCLETLNTVPINFQVC
jgi:quinol monooxygenase YgiN